MSKVKNIVRALGSAEEFAAAAADETRLVIFDVHASWCGPCTVMESLWRRLAIELDRCDERLAVYTVDVALLSPEQRAAMHASAGSCKPLFLAYKSRVQIGRVASVSAPELNALIADNVPVLDQTE